MAPKSASSHAYISPAATLQSLWQNYVQATSAKLKLIDAFLAFICLSGVLQFLYCLLITNFPFNAFLGGFASTIGQFVLLAGLRIQSNPENKDMFPSVSQERAFADFIFASVVLHFFVFNFLG